MASNSGAQIICRIPPLYPRAYPGYVIGRLGNGCTAFFIGPYQALTAAHCVYKRSTRQWKKWALDIEGLYDCKKPAHVMSFHAVDMALVSVDHASANRDTLASTVKIASAER